MIISTKYESVLNISIKIILFLHFGIKFLNKNMVTCICKVDLNPNFFLHIPTVKSVNKERGSIIFALVTQKHEKIISFPVIKSEDNV